MKQVACGFICFIYLNVSAAFPYEDLRKKYPNAKIKIVSLDEYEQLKKTYANNSEEVQNPTEKTFDPCVGGYDQPKFHSVTEANPSFSFNTYTSTSNKDTLVIIAVVGLVVVAALIVYSVSYLHQMTKNGFKCKVGNDFGLRYSHIWDNTQNQIRAGNLSGVYYSSNYSVSFGTMGLMGELGRHELNLSVKPTNGSKTYAGAYLLVGPSFSIPFRESGGSAFQIELLAGTSSDNNIGLMSTLRFGIDFKFNSSTSFGLNLGAALIDIKDFKNYLMDSDQLNYLSGVSFASRW